MNREEEVSKRERVKESELERVSKREREKLRATITDLTRREWELPRPNEVSSAA